LRKQSLFTKERLVYWPSEFSDVMRLLTGQDVNGRQITAPLYQFNTGALVLAAAIGVVNRRQRDVGGDRKEISTQTFSSHGLEDYIFLVPLIARGEVGVNQLRPEHEEDAIREFERVAAGGLEFLRTELANAPTQSADFVIEGLVSRSAPRGEPRSRPTLI
jgi:hypothetical protein